MLECNSFFIAKLALDGHHTCKIETSCSSCRASQCALCQLFTCIEEPLGAPQPSCRPVSPSYILRYFPDIHSPLLQNLRYEYQDVDERVHRDVLASLVDAAADMHNRELLTELLVSNDATRRTIHAMSVAGFGPHAGLLFTKKWLKELDIETREFYTDAVIFESPIDIALGTRGQRTNGR